MVIRENYLFAIFLGKNIVYLDFKTEHESAALCYHLKNKNRLEYTNKTCRKLLFSTPVKVGSVLLKRQALGKEIQINRIAI